ncbi:DNA-binding protein [Mesorhizobium sp. M7A.F.Ce.TU.012.03.2.1]|nr:DNA-binding protein [Mesorhizobium sp. M7A.F.Ce.TU.012.03.2.1]
MPNTNSRGLQVLFSTKEAAAHIAKSPSWLNKSRMAGCGPVYLKLGGGVRYALPDLEAWLAASRRTAVYDHANDNLRARAAA